jgi:sterol desaturase/sphingolipid hydroxylase (fatty acid hydroxylase superfamily)
MAAAAIGVFVWTLVEYLLHRFAFHRFAGLTRSSHPNHHAASRDLQYLFAPPAVVAGISLPLTVVLSLLLGSAAALKFMGGLLAGYLYYEAVHYRIHFANSEGWLIRRQRKAHFRHHFHDATQDFGVTTPLWDWVFGTSNPRPAAR